MSFIAERISEYRTIDLDAPLEAVFPLFGPIEESKWAPGWAPRIVFLEGGQIQDQMVFKTDGHQDLEGEYTWIVSRYEPENAFVEYTVFTPDRLWRISIRCIESTRKERTEAEICYSYTGLSEKGNMMNRHALDSMFAQDLKDWEKQINYYLETGRKPNQT